MTLYIANRVIYIWYTCKSVFFLGLHLWVFSSLCGKFERTDPHALMGPPIQWDYHFPFDGKLKMKIKMVIVNWKILRMLITEDSSKYYS